jgi:DDE superfamily endonuclease
LPDGPGFVPPHPSPDGDIVWVSGPLPGAVHDLTVARTWGIVRELAASGLVVLADKGYAGADEHIRTPYKGRNKPVGAENLIHVTRPGDTR